MISGIFILKGKVELLSPALIGSGNSERCDMDLLLDEKDKPFIPATSLIGVLRHTMSKMEIKQNDLKRFWGFIDTDKISDEEKVRASHLICSDLTCSTKNPQIRTRDGIKIDSRSGIVEEGMKYDYEVVERGTRFDLCLEVPYLTPGNEDQNQKRTVKYLDPQFIQQMLATIIGLLQDEKAAVGAKTNNGLGRIKLTDHRLLYYNFKQKDHVLKWLGIEDGEPEPHPLAAEAFKIERKCFTLEAWLELKNSLMIRSYPTELGAPDADFVHIQSNGDYVVPGSSWKGAIRARAERILNTISINKENWTQGILNELFGFVDPEKPPSENAQRGRIRISETVLPKFVAELQTRIKIDRFTGGTIETALFESLPLFNRLKTGEVVNLRQKAVRLNLSIDNCKEYEAGLLLLILKDLWTGDLAIGGEKNVGRGVFRGMGATLQFNDQPPINLPENIAQLDTDSKNKLEKYVTALAEKAKEAK